MGDDERQSLDFGPGSLASHRTFDMCWPERVQKPVFWQVLCELWPIATTSCHPTHFGRINNARRSELARWADMAASRTEALLVAARRLRM